MPQPTSSSPSPEAELHRLQDKLAFAETEVAFALSFVKRSVTNLVEWEERADMAKAELQSFLNPSSAPSSNPSEEPQ